MHNGILPCALRAHDLRCRRNGWIPQSPSRPSSTVEGDMVFLRNSRRVLAAYWVMGGRLRYDAARAQEGNR